MSNIENLGIFETPVLETLWRLRQSCPGAADQELLEMVERDLERFRILLDAFQQGVEEE